MQRRNGKNSGGFTLIELMVGIAVLALTLGFGIPAFQSARANADLRGATMDLVTAFNVARAEAISRRTRIQIKPTDGTNWTSGWLVDYDPTAPDATQTAELQHFNVDGTVTVKEAASHQAVEFREDGMLLDVASSNITTLSFEICDDRPAEIGRTINVNQFGRLENIRHADATPCQ